MASRTYQNFDLLLEAAEGGEFRARVTKSPLDESPSGRFTLPFNPTQLENLLLKLDPGRTGTRRAGSDPQSQASMDLGGPLFESVFSEDIMLTWQRSQDYARDQGDGLRLRLRLTDAPSIAGLPWELLYDRRGNSFIAQSERTPVVRYLEVPQPPRPLTVDGALRILVVISSPTDLPELDVEAEWRRVQDALGEQGRRRHREDRPAAGADRPGALGVAAAERRPHPPLHRPRRLRRPDPGRRRLLPGPVRPQHQGQPDRPRPLPARPRPAAAGPAQRMPVRPRRHHRPVQRDGAGTGPAGLHRCRRDAVPHQRRCGHDVHRRVLRCVGGRLPGRPGGHQRPQGPHRRVCSGVGHPGALPPLPRRARVRPHRRPADAHRRPDSASRRRAGGRGAGAAGAGRRRRDDSDEAQDGRGAARCCTVGERPHARPRRCGRGGRRGRGHTHTVDTAGGGSVGTGSVSTASGRTRIPATDAAGRRATDAGGASAADHPAADRSAADRQQRPHHSRPSHSRPDRSRRNRSSRRTSRPTSRRRPTRPGLGRSRPNHRRVRRRRGTPAGGPGRSRGGA